ncbi:hypothetical protein NA57DRAFT_76636 [Rhizodiscina lignyota]|uniref:Uncharacterized protein n=1 Tax=Rhizodiscina lignyota TaxID=1504668 RepID=A0A9P4IBQ7_9PEZI|nr:hypothetical protein NA57DRAFT_76636 [Rhizodiscina lignyota]
MRLSTLFTAFALSATGYATIATSTPAPTTSKPLAVRSEPTCGPSAGNVLQIFDYLNFNVSGISAGASIIKVGSSVVNASYTMPQLTLTMACLTPTPTAASDLCSSASLYTWTYGPRLMKYQFPEEWFLNGQQRSDSQITPSLTAWWTESCVFFGDPVSSMKCHEHWTSFTFDAQRGKGEQLTYSTFSEITTIDVTVTAGLDKIPTTMNSLIADMADPPLPCGLPTLSANPGSSNSGKLSTATTTSVSPTAATSADSSEQSKSNANKYIAAFAAVALANLVAFLLIT